MGSESARLGASFRDPSGFLFQRNQRLYRQVNRAYQGDYDLLIGSGLYDELADAGLLIRHRETDAAPEDPALAYRVIEPEPVSFISYPYEWSFGQLQAAALTTLEIQKRALARGMSLKDSSAYNIQFHRAQPLLIDSLSFEAYREGEPWDAVGSPTDRSFYMEVRNEAFVGEVGTMGHGLQMWLQTMWFLARAAKAHTVILDEPAVYMHPDLQRRLIRFMRRRFPQVIVATHSVEIMAEVEPDEILIVDRTRHRSRFTPGLPAVQALIDHVGSVHNIHLAKLSHARKCVFVEGNDLKLLSEFQQTLTPDSSDPISALPNMSVGGVGRMATCSEPLPIS